MIPASYFMRSAYRDAFERPDAPQSTPRRPPLGAAFHRHTLADLWNGILHRDVRPGRAHRLPQPLRR